MNVGEFVRIDGYISKIEHMKTSSSGKTYVQWRQPNGLLASANIKLIEKSSPQIIDLIEVGDYVNYNHFNGGIVLAKTDDEITTNTILLHNLKNEDIKNVTTHEQMEAMQYRVEE